MLTLENAVLHNSAEKDVVSVLGPLVPVPCHSTQTACRHIGETLLSEFRHFVCAENISYANTQQPTQNLSLKSTHNEAYYFLIKWNGITNIPCSPLWRESLELTEDASLARIQDYLDLHVCNSPSETKS